MYPRGLLKVLHARTGRFTSRVEPAPLDKVATPATLADAFGALKPGAMVLGGGTDLRDSGARITVLRKQPGGDIDQIFPHAVIALGLAAFRLLRWGHLRILLGGAGQPRGPEPWSGLRARAV